MEHRGEIEGLLKEPNANRGALGALMDSGIDILGDNVYYNIGGESLLVFPVIIVRPGKLSLKLVGKFFFGQGKEHIYYTHMLVVAGKTLHYFEYILFDKYEQSCKYFKRALEIEPDDEDAKWFIAQCGIYNPFSQHIYYTHMLVVAGKTLHYFEYILFRRRKSLCKSLSICHSLINRFTVS